MRLYTVLKRSAVLTCVAALFLIAVQASVPARAAKAPTPAPPAAADFIKDASTALDAGKLDNALDLFKKAISVDAKSHEAYYGVGLVNFDLRKYSESEDALVKAVQLSPSTVKYHYALGLVYAVDAKKSLATAEFQQALKLDPKHAPSRYQLGALLLDSGDENGAVKEWQLAIQSDPAYAPALYELGNVYAKRGNRDQAIDSFTLTVKHDPLNADALFKLAKLLSDRNKGYDAANSIWYLKRFRLLAAKTADKSLLDDVDKTLTQFESKAAYTFFKLGADNMSDPRVSADYFSRAIDLRQDFPEAYYNLGLALEQLGDNDQALFCLQKAAQMAPKQPDVQAALGSLYLVMKKPFQAETAFTAAIKLSPGNASWQVYKAVAVWQAGRPDEARTQLQQVTKENPKLGTAWYNLACLEARTNRPKEAVAALKQAIAVEPRYKAMAKEDTDLVSLKGNADFKALIADPKK